MYAKIKIEIFYWVLGEVVKSKYRNQVLFSTIQVIKVIQFSL